MAFPIPVAAPVTIAILFWSFIVLCESSLGFMTAFRFSRARKKIASFLRCCPWQGHPCERPRHSVLTRGINSVVVIVDGECLRSEYADLRNHFFGGDKPEAVDLLVVP